MQAKIKKSILFIINPKAGTRGIRIIEIKIKEILKENINHDILYLGDSKDESKIEISKKLNNGKFNTVVAVGGDGTVNSVASLLIGSEFVLGILPIGSGNGLAREMRIPMDIKNSIINSCSDNYTEIDCCYINEIPFFCTAGIGFDAHVGKLFANSKKRGLLTYARITMKEFKKYKAENYLLSIDGIEKKFYAFQISFANASQYGNNAVIAPNADIRDGIIEITVLKPFGFWDAFGLIYRLFNRTIHKSRFVETFSGRKIKVLRENEGVIHYDGESEIMGRELFIEIKEKKLKIATK